MVPEFASVPKAVGLKQTRKAIRERRAVRVFLACDADPVVTNPVAAQCAAAGVPVVTDFTMGQLGKACGISVGASAVAVL